MNNRKLDTIKARIIDLLYAQCGYAGLADSPNVAIINSGNGEENFVITIKDQGAIDAQKNEQRPE